MFKVGLKTLVAVGVNLFGAFIVFSIFMTPISLIYFFVSALGLMAFIPAMKNLPAIRKQLGVE